MSLNVWLLQYSEFQVILRITHKPAVNIVNGNLNFKHRQFLFTIKPFKFQEARPFCILTKHE